MDLDDIHSEIELKTDTEKIVYLVDLLKKMPKDDQKEIYEMLNPIVQSKYERMVKRRLIFGVGSLQRLTRMKPMLDKSVIMQAYEDLITNKPSCFAEKVQTLYKVTAERPMVDEGIVRSAYEWAIENERVNDFEIIRGITGVKPDEEHLKAIKDLRDKIEKKLAELREDE